MADFQGGQAPQRERGLSREVVHLPTRGAGQTIPSQHLSNLSRPQEEQIRPPPQLRCVSNDVIKHSDDVITKGSPLLTSAGSCRGDRGS